MKNLINKLSKGETVNIETSKEWDFISLIDECDEINFNHVSKKVNDNGTTDFFIETYDVQFDNETDSNSEGFETTYSKCQDFIEAHNGTDYSYFGDYKGGSVSIVSSVRGLIHTEDIK